MAIKRRTFLACLGSFFIPIESARSVASKRNMVFVNAFAERDHFGVAGFDQSGLVFQHRLPARGHAIAKHLQHDAIAVFARRPGDFIHILDSRTGQQIGEIFSVPRRHFYGHGVFSSDGLLYATANQYQSGQGVICIYDSNRNYEYLGEIPVYGVGPHDIKLLKDDETLVVAVGGIQTHPNYPRVKLNLNTMQPCLNYINRHSGVLVASYRLPSKYHQLSIRHLDVNSNNQVAFAVQDEGPRPNLNPLVGSHKLGEPVNLFHADRRVLRRMRRYCGSVIFDSSGRYIIVSSPRGGVITVWDSFTNEYLTSYSLQDGCGLAETQKSGSFMASSGTGELLTVTLGTPVENQWRTVRRLIWDNHMISYH